MFDIVSKCQILNVCSEKHSASLIIAGHKHEEMSSSGRIKGMHGHLVAHVQTLFESTANGGTVSKLTFVKIFLKSRFQVYLFEINFGHGFAFVVRPVRWSSIRTPNHEEWDVAAHSHDERQEQRTNAADISRYCIFACTQKKRF